MNMTWKKITTMEHLEMDGCSSQGAVLKYRDHVLVCGLDFLTSNAASHFTRLHRSLLMTAAMQSNGALTGLQNKTNEPAKR
jgi:hypothetical protein